MIVNVKKGCKLYSRFSKNVKTLNNCVKLMQKVKYYCKKLKIFFSFGEMARFLCAVIYCYFKNRFAWQKASSEVVIKLLFTYAISLLYINRIGTRI